MPDKIGIDEIIRCSIDLLNAEPNCLGVGFLGKLQKFLVSPHKSLCMGLTIPIPHPQTVENPASEGKIKRLVAVLMTRLVAVLMRRSTKTRPREKGHEGQIH